MYQLPFKLIYMVQYKVFTEKAVLAYIFYPLLTLEFPLINIAN